MKIFTVAFVVEYCDGNDFNLEVSFVSVASFDGLKPADPSKNLLTALNNPAKDVNTSYFLAPRWHVLYTVCDKGSLDHSRFSEGTGKEQGHGIGIIVLQRCCVV